MVKDRLKTVIAMLVAIIMLFSCTATFADNETTTESTNEDDIIVTTDEDSDEIYVDDEESEYTDEDSEETDTDEDDLISEDEDEDSQMQESDLYEYGQEVNIDYTIDGNAFIVADTVTISGQIGGDVFIIANTINIDGGYVYSNVFAIADTININGILYDLYTSANTINISEEGYVYRDVHAMADNINLFGIVGRDMYATFNNISFTSDEDDSSNGTIYGSLNYTSSQEISADDYVEGDVKFTQAVSSDSGSSVDVGGLIRAIIVYIIIAGIAYMIYTKLATKFKQSSSKILTDKFLPVVGFGILGIVVTFVIAIILMLFAFSMKLILLLCALLAAIYLVCSLTFIVTISELIASKANSNGTWSNLGIVALTTLVLILVELIPYIGGFIEFVAIVLGAGTIIKYCFPEKKKDSEA